MPDLGPVPSSGGSTAPVAASVAKLISGRYSIPFSSPASAAPGESFLYDNTVGEGAAYPAVFDTSGTLNQLALEVTTSAAGSFVRLGVYANSAGLPGALIADAGQIDASTTGVKTVTVSVPIVAGTVYWFGFVLQGAAGAKVRSSAPAGPEMPAASTGSITFYVGFGIATAGVTAAFPGTWSGSGSAVGAASGFQFIPRLMARAA